MPRKDRRSIVANYDALVDLHPSPVIMLNRAVAVGFRDGPEAGLDLLAQVEAIGDLEFYPLLAAVRADLLRRAGRTDEAIVAYGRAIERAGTGAERRLFQRRLDELTTRLRSPASGTSSAGNCKGE